MSGTELTLTWSVTNGSASPVTLTTSGGGERAYATGSGAATADEYGSDGFGVVGDRVLASGESFSGTTAFVSHDCGDTSADPVTPVPPGTYSATYCLAVLSVRVGTGPATDRNDRFWCVTTAPFILS